MSVRIRATYAPSRELLSQVALVYLAWERQDALDHTTRDRALEDADRSIAGWREAREDSLHYHYPERTT